MLNKVKSYCTIMRRFFINYVWLGVALLLISIILDMSYPIATRSRILAIAIKAVEGIGLSVLIASIFSFASGTTEFINKIRELLEDIVLHRNFLGNIDPDRKKDAIKTLIQPSSAEKNKYPNIINYYDHFINTILKVSTKNVRSNYQVNSRAFFDSEKKKIAVEGTYSYRLYPAMDGYNDITVGFHEDESGSSYCSYVKITDPNGELLSVTLPELEVIDVGGDKNKVATISIKDFGNNKNHLDVELCVTEYGQNHWALEQFKALQPTDGFRFSMRCDGGIQVQEHAIFVVGAKFYVNISEDKKCISVNCNQWINEGSGLCVLVSIPHD